MTASLRRRSAAALVLAGLLVSCSGDDSSA
jgi:hypothetical protein